MSLFPRDPPSFTNFLHPFPSEWRWWTPGILQLLGCTAGNPQRSPTVPNNFSRIFNIVDIPTYLSKKPYFMSTIIIVGGPAGTGKTTVAEILANHYDNCPFVEGDSLHPEANIKKMSAGQPLTDDDRWGWLANLSEVAAKKAHDAPQKICIASCSMLKKVYRDHIKKSAHGVDSELKFKFVFLHTSYDELMQRVNGRQGHYMKLDMVKSQYDIMEIPQGEELLTAGGDSMDVDTSGRTPEDICKGVIAEIGI